MPRTATPPLHPELAAELARRGLSHAELSHALGISSPYVGMIIRGNARPSRALKLRMAAVLDRPLHELFADEVAS